MSSDKRQPVAVKPLEWEEYASDGSTFKARTDLAHYVVWEIGGRGYLAKAPGPGQAQNGDLDAAKAAAQADFNQRILSALAHPPAKREAWETAPPESHVTGDSQGRVEELEEALKAVLAALVAATSILDRADLAGRRPSKVVGSDTMFVQMLKDFAYAEIKGRVALTTSTPPPQSRERVSDTPSAALEESHE